jgi:hypothetical protein
MDREDIIKMAKEVWMAGDVYIGPNHESLERFAQLVKQQLLAEAYANAYHNMTPEYFEFIEPLLALPDDAALKEIIQQAKREVLEAADKCDEGYRIRARSAK